MKKRSMKKWIPKGMYCHGDGSKKRPYCKWLRYLGTVKRDKSNCKYSKDCNEKCWSTSEASCDNHIYRCDYLKYTDFNQDSLLWDECKECGVKNED